MADWETEIYHILTYPMVDAAHYLHIPTVTLRAWLKGRTYPINNDQHYSAPLIQRSAPDSPQLFFHQSDESPCAAHYPGA